MSLQRKYTKSLKICTGNNLRSTQQTTSLPTRPLPVSLNSEKDHIIKGEWVRRLYCMLVMKTKLSIRLTSKKRLMQKPVGLFLKFMSLTKLAFTLQRRDLVILHQHRLVSNYAQKIYYFNHNNHSCCNIINLHYDICIRYNQPNQLNMLIILPWSVVPLRNPRGMLSSHILREVLCISQSLVSVDAQMLSFTLSIMEKQRLCMLRHVNELLASTIDI